MPKLQFDQRSLDLTILNFRGTKKALQQAQKVAIALAGEQYKNAVIANLSVPPIGGSAESHQRALAQRGHPYSRRFASPRIRPAGGFPGFGRRDLLVHSVSGKLRAAIKGVFDPKGPTYRVDVDTSTAPHARYVFQGTKVMLPRDVLGATAADRAVRQELQRTIIRVFGEIFRTGAGIRFGPTGGGGGRGGGGGGGGRARGPDGRFI